MRDSRPFCPNCGGETEQTASWPMIIRDGKDYSNAAGCDFCGWRGYVGDCLTAQEREGLTRAGNNVILERVGKDADENT